MYKSSATTPTLFPSGSSTYTWATGQFTAPATPNGWSLTPPAAVLGETLWIARTLYADNNTTATSSVTWNATTALAISTSGVDGTAGSDGANGYRTGFLELYQWASATPNSFPAGNSVYTWADGTFTLPTTPNSWSLTPGSASAGQTLYACSVRYADNLTTTTSVVTWNTGTAYVIGAAGTNGTNGVNGTRTAVLDMYKWSATQPTSSFPSGTSTYTWSSGQFTAPPTPNGWSLTPPASVAGQTLWIARTVYADSNTTSTTSVTWNATSSFAAGVAGTNGTNGADGANGANGARTAFLEVYLWAATTPTTFPSGTSIYTWADGSFTAPSTPNNWSLTPGASSAGYKLYACSVRYADSLTTSTTSITWNTSTAYVVGASGTNGANGANGANGTNGTNGTDGSPGSATFLVTRAANDSSAPTNGETTAAIGRTPVAGDIATVSYNNANNAVVYRFTTSWITQSTYITGSLIVQNTITADRLSVSNLSSISADIGTITAGSISGTSLSVGSSPAVSGTTMTGTGAKINTNGTFALGNSTTNISYNGTQMSLNGNVVATANINANAVTIPSSAYTTGSITLSTGSYQTIQSLTVTAANSTTFIINTSFTMASSSNYSYLYAQVLRDTTVLFQTGLCEVGTYNFQQPPPFVINVQDVVSAGTYTYYLKVYVQAFGNVFNNRLISVMGTMR
jgi:hypothetical protein